MLSNNEKVLYSGVVVIAVALGMYILREKQSQAQGAKVVTYQQLDQVRKDTSTRVKLEKRKTEVINIQTAPRLDNNMREVSNGLNEPNNNGIRLEGEKIHSIEDSADASVYDSPMNSLETQINKKLVNDQHAAQMSIIQKKEFIKDYKKRALAMGYNVELNDRLELIRAEKVKSKTVGYEKAPASVIDVESMEEDQYIDEE
ncbi:MAG: hypothetical protein IT287_05650 [Bdellovibrionaceae bacterium]|nr:hypothetical protein [Pseudobdellovibrionaceae bacterium]